MFLPILLLVFLALFSSSATAEDRPHRPSRRPIHHQPTRTDAYPYHEPTRFTWLPYIISTVTTPFHTSIPNIRTHYTRPTSPPHYYTYARKEQGLQRRCPLPRCRCTPTDPCWPTSEQFQNLSSSLTNPLVHIRPIGEVCHDPTFNSASCANVMANQFNGNWRSDQIGAAIYPDGEEAGFGAQNCSLASPEAFPCEQGNVPVIGVNVSTVGDVRRAVVFAATYNLKLVVKNTGHFPSRSLNNGSFMIWTHNLKTMQFTDSFIPTQAPAGARGEPAVTIGAGVQWGELYDAVAARNHTIVGGFGAGGSVGAAGGWPMGGGHSALSPLYGLGADNVLEMQVVLADGSFVTTNRYLRPDLFWALRGGGGPSFGVATSLTYRLHPDASLVSGNFMAVTNSTDSYIALLDAVQSYVPVFSDNGYSGFYPFSPQSVSFTYVKLNGSLDAATAFFAPIYERLGSIPGVNVTFARTVPYARFYDWYNQGWGHDSARVIGFNYTASEPAGINAAQSSRLLPRRVYEDPTVRAQLTRVLAQIPTGGRGFHVLGGTVSQIPRDAIAANPAFRGGLVAMTLGTLIPPGSTPEQAQQFLEVVDSWGQQLRDLTPESGTYLNEAEVNQPNFTTDFWGENYPRLVQIKKRYDPHLVFMAPQTVGAEHWDATTDCQLTSF